MTEKEYKWHQRYMGLCDLVGSWSEDPRKQVGACVIRDNRVVSVGFNGLPTGVIATEERLQNRDIKLMFFEHAERNALYTAGKMGHTLDGAIMYCNWFPCNDCARGIIQSGIKTLVTYAPEVNSRWYEQMLIGETMMKEAGINLIYLENGLQDRGGCDNSCSH